MKVKNLNIFKKHFEKKEQLKLQKKDEFIKKIKKDWTKEELVEMQIKYMLELYCNTFGHYASFDYKPCDAEELSEFRIKYHMLHSSGDLLSEEEIIDLLNFIKNQKIKKKNI